MDRAALDIAIAMGIPCGGWCPMGRRAEDGFIPERYPLKETDSHDYRVRTKWNVRDSDGSLIITRGRPKGGTSLTIRFAAEMGRPCLVVNVCSDDEVSLDTWVNIHTIKTLNVAGPRESDNPGIYEEAATFLQKALDKG